MDPSIQHVLSANQAVNTTSPSYGLPPDATSFLSLLFSLTALREGVKLLLLGGLLETFRDIPWMIYAQVANGFFLTVQFEQYDISFAWMMVWLSKYKSWSQARSLQISANSFSLSNQAILVPGEENDEDTNSWSHFGNRKLAYIPSVGATQTMLYKGHLMRITRTQVQSGNYNRAEDRLTIRILTRDHSFLNELLLEAKKEYMAAKKDSVSVYVSDGYNEWRHVASRPKRSMRSIILDPGIKDLLLNDARDFLGSRAWYTARGIPFRRGYLLYGAPGSGKTSIIHSLAAELDLDVYIISLSRSGLDDAALSRLVSNLPQKCITLMEDIDAAFLQSVNRDTSSDAPSRDGSRSDTDISPERPSRSTGSSDKLGDKVSLSGLLNALDGIGAQEGRILFATTNKYAALDPALCRPGRMDIHIEFKLASKYQAWELYRCFYFPDGETTSDSQEKDEGSNASSNDSGCLSCCADPMSEELSSQTGCDERPTLSSNFHGKIFAPSLPLSRLTELADEFRAAVPEREFSMASLQGYLMGYKTRPIEAVKDVVLWIEKERLLKSGSGPCGL